MRCPCERAVSEMVGDETRRAKPVEVLSEASWERPQEGLKDVNVITSSPQGGHKRLLKDSERSLHLMAVMEEMLLKTLSDTGWLSLGSMKFISSCLAEMF